MFILTLIVFTNGSCISTIGNLLADTLIDPKNELIKLAPYIYFSGKGINDFGLYEDCSKYYQYAIAQFFVPSTPASVNLGLCISQECKIQDINRIIHKIQSAIMKYTEILLKVDLSGYELKLITPEERESPDIYSIFVLFSLIAFLIIQGIFTYIQYNMKRLNNNNIIQRDQDIQEISTYFDEEEQQLKQQQQQQQQQYQKKQNNYQLNLNSFYILKFNFNIITNFKECCIPSNSKYEILNFFRFLGFIMCVFGDTGVSMLLQCDFLQVFHYAKHYILLIVFGCLYSVEIFLWLSGFFAVLSLNKSIKGFWLRIAKLWSLNLIILMINTNIVPYLGNSPRWFYIQRYTQCGKLWENLLLISNFDDENYCSLWLWQLQLDVQLFIVCVIIMIIYMKNKIFGIGITISLLCLCQVYVIYTCIIKEYGIPYFASYQTDIYKAFYFRPWYRAPPYFIGMLIGFCKLNINKINLKTYQSKKIFNILSCLMIFIGSFIIIYLTVGWYDTMQKGENYYNKLFAQIYEGTMRTFYTIGLTLIALPNIFGKSNIFYKALNYTPIRYIVKFTLAGYLLHMIIVEIVICSFNRSLDFNVQSITQVYIGCLVILGFASFFFRWLVELPLQIKHKRIYEEDEKKIVEEF